MNAVPKRFPAWLACAAALLCLLALANMHGQTPQISPSVGTANDSQTTTSRTTTASEFLEQGLTAERAGNWEKALTAYAGAVALAPNDASMRARLGIAQFQVVQQRTQLAEQQLLNDRKDLAIETLRSALRLDPTYLPARERLEQLEQQRTFDRALPPPRRASGPPKVAAEAGKRMFDYRGQTRGAYEELARQFGVVATFDSDLTDRAVRFRVDAVDFTQAMDILGQLTGTFWISIDDRTFLVMPDTAAKRNQYEPEITVSLPFASSESTDDMTETTRVVRDITGIRRSTLDADSHMLTLRDTPDHVELARELMHDIDQPRGEVMLDIDVLEVNRNAAQRIGITPPSQSKIFTLSTGQIRQLEAARNNGTLVQVLQGIFGSLNPLASGTNLAALVPPLIAFGGGSTTFLATLPGATADFSRTLSVVRQAQRVILRVKDGEDGSLFVGDHYPITLALLSQSLVSGQSQFSPGLAAGAFPRTDFDTGTSPGSVAVADFNGDGNLDLAVTNQAADNVSILLGNGKGSFGAHTEYTTGTGPVGIASIDIDRDGKIDLAIACDTEGVVSLLRGNGDGTFAAATNLPAGASPSSILARDMTKDDIADLIVTNRSDDTVSIYVGNGDGTFAARQSFAVGDGPSAVAAADFDNDGNSDLAVANQSDGTASVLKGVGDGFTTRIDVNAGAGPIGIATGDFDGDGRPDLAVANSTDNTISVFQGDGNGSFTTRTNLNTGGTPSALFAGDFNADQVPDLVSANQQDNNVSIFLSLRNGSFATALQLPTGNAPVALAAGDLNKDGRPDLVVANRASNNVTVTLNSTTVPVSPNAPLTSYPASQFVDLGLKVKATPRIHPDEEVTLRLQFELTALSGRDVNGIPIIGNRVVDQMVRLRENETSVISGMFGSNDQRSTIGPNPFGLLSGTLASRNSSDADTEMIIAITPRLIRIGPRTGRTLYAGRGEGPTAPPLQEAQPGVGGRAGESGTVIPLPQAPPTGEGPGVAPAPSAPPGEGSPAGPGEAPGTQLPPQQEFPAETQAPDEPVNLPPGQ